MKKIPLLMVLLIASAFGISQGDVSLTTPADGTYTSLSNYSTGFVFEWEDLDDNSYNQSNCYLYMNQTYSNLAALLDSDYIHGNATTDESTATTLNQTQSFSDEGAYYWTVQCNNSSALHLDSWSPTPRVIYFDNSTPEYNVIDTSFTNATWGTSGTVRFQVNISDVSGTGWTVILVNGSNVSQQLGSSVSLANWTNTNATFSLDDGEHTAYLNFSDSAGHVNQSSSIYSIKIDSTAPVVAYVSPTPDDGSVTHNGTVTFNFTVTEQNLDTVLLGFNDSEFDIAKASNCSGSAPDYVCSYSYASLSEDTDVQFNVTVNDSAGTEGNGAERTFGIDNSTPAVTTAYNWTVSSSSISFTALITDATPSTCIAKIYNSTDSNVANVTGTYGTVGATTNCTGTISPSDIGTDGAFTVIYEVADEVGNSTTSNKTGVLKTLYSGWNLVAFQDTNRTVASVCSMIDGCSQVSKYNNSAHTFTTYSASTPSVNNDTQIEAGDAVFVYVSSTSYLLMNDHAPAEESAEENVSVYDNGWNAIGLIENATVNTTLYMADFETDNENVTWVSYINTTGGFVTCSKSLALCTGTSTHPVNLTLPRGSAIWALSDANVTVNRSALSG